MGVLGLTQCRPSVESNTSEKKKVLTTFTILEDMLKEVAGDAIDVVCITKPGAEIHDYEITPHDLVKAKGAALVFSNGLGLERWLEKFLQHAGTAQHVVLSEGVTPLGIGEGPYSGMPNPHAWMSPANAKKYVENIKQSLSLLAPEHADAFAQRAQTYSAELEVLDQRFKAEIGKVEAGKRWLVTCEGAFSYLTKDYGMKELYLWPVNADEEGTPQQIKKVIDVIREHQIPVTFSESTISDKAMQQVSKESGAKYAGVLYVDSLTEAGGEAPTYLKLLEYNVQRVLSAFEEAKASQN